MPMSYAQWEKLDDAAAEAQKAAAVAEQEALEAAIEAEQTAFVYAADAIHSALVEHNGLFWFWVEDATDQLDAIAASPVFFGETLIAGLSDLVEAFQESRWEKSAAKPALLIVLEAMAANDPTADESSPGQIQQQAKEARELLGA